MSKIPLRGEIWRSEDEMLHIVRTYDNLVHFVYKSYGNFYVDSMHISSFVKLYRFVTNAKIDVEELFEVKEEENG